MLREMLADRDEATLRRGAPRGPGDHRQRAAAQRRAARPLVANRLDRPARRWEIDARPDAREDLNFPFVELSARSRRWPAAPSARFSGFYGQNAYRRYEPPRARGGDRGLSRGGHRHCGRLVSDLGSFNLLLRRCTTVWLMADPEDHMAGSWRRAIAAHGGEPGGDGRLEVNRREPGGVLFKSRSLPGSTTKRSVVWRKLPDPAGFGIGLSQTVVQRRKRRLKLPRSLTRPPQWR